MLRDPTWAYTVQDAEAAQRGVAEASQPLHVAEAPRGPAVEAEDAGAPQYFLPSDLIGNTEISDGSAGPRTRRRRPRRPRAQVTASSTVTAVVAGPAAVAATTVAAAAATWATHGPQGRFPLGAVYLAQPPASPPTAAGPSVAAASAARGPAVPATQPALAPERVELPGAAVREAGAEWCEPLAAANHQLPAVSPFIVSKWHSSAMSAGDLSEDGHIFAKSRAGPRKIHSNGMLMSSLCMIFERNLRVGGTHRYHYNILKGSVGAADGVGFVFDSRIRRTNIQRMKSVFLNKHGQVCIRNLDSITKLPCSLPKLSEGVSIFLTVDLDRAAACFKMDDSCGKHLGTANLSFAWLLLEKPDGRPVPANLSHVRSGFFCAIVTGGITVSLQ